MFWRHQTSQYWCRRDKLLWLWFASPNWAILSEELRWNLQHRVCWHNSQQDRKHRPLLPMRKCSRYGPGSSPSLPVGKLLSSEKRQMNSWNSWSYKEESIAIDCHCLFHQFIRTFEKFLPTYNARIVHENVNISHVAFNHCGHIVNLLAITQINLVGFWLQKNCMNESYWTFAAYFNTKLVKHFFGLGIHFRVDIPKSNSCAKFSKLISHMKLYFKKMNLPRRPSIGQVHCRNQWSAPVSSQ